MYSRVPLHKVRYVTFGEVWGCTKRPPRSTKGTFFSEPIPVKELLSYSRIASFSTPEMASSTTTSQAPRRRSPGLFTIFYEEITAAPITKPTRRSPSKSNKLTVSHSN
jgi:hypothetical protein